MPYYNVLYEVITVSMETKQCIKKLTCDCMTHHGTQPVCKVSDLNFYSFSDTKINKSRK